MTICTVTAATMCCTPATAGFIEWVYGDAGNNSAQIDTGVDMQGDVLHACSPDRSRFFHPTTRGSPGGPRVFLLRQSRRSEPFAKLLAMAHELGIIGAGNMAEAIARGVISKGVLRADQIIAADVSPERRALFEKQLHVKAVQKNGAAAQGAKVVLLSVKPQHMAAAQRGSADDRRKHADRFHRMGIGTSFIE